MNKKGSLVNSLVGVFLIGVALISVIFSFVGSATTLSSQTDSLSVPYAIPVNITLTKDSPVALVSVLNASGSVIPASNYTDAISSGYLTMLDNSTVVDGDSVEVTYTYKADGYVDSSNVRLLLLLIPLFVGLFFLLKAGRIAGK